MLALHSKNAVCLCRHQGYHKIREARSAHLCTIFDF
nr:MAG TPA: hypothetical protein [Caudoviricetes sp.]